MSILNRGKLPTPLKPTPFNLGRFWLPKLVFVGVCTIIVLDQTGDINLPHILQFNSNKTQNEAFKDSSVYVFQKAAPIGVPWKYNFGPELIALLDPSGTASPAIYSFYLGSGVGFPPMGLTLGIDGVLSGTPTGNGGNFEVCVKDVGGRSACKKYSLNVQPKSTPALTPKTTNTKPALKPAPIVQPKSIPTPTPTSIPASNKNSSECNPVNDCDDYVHCPTCPVPMEVRRNVDCICPNGTTDAGVKTIWLEINGKWESAQKRICMC